MHDTPTLIALGCVGAFALLLAAFIYINQRHRKARAEHLARLGFAPLDSASAVLHAGVERLYRHSPKQRLQVGNAYQRALHGGTMFVFDAADTASGDVSALGSGLLGLYSGRISLPFFTLVPWSGGAPGGIGGMVAGTAQTMLDWAMAKAGLEKIVLPYAGDFHQHYSLFGKDPAAVLDLLTPERAAALLALGARYELLAAGDFFTIKQGVSPDQRRSFTFSTDPDTMMADAARILAILAGGR